MSVPQTIRRRIADLLVRRACRAMPSGRQIWADAMQIEIQHITDDGQCLGWAFGCLLASYTERFRALQIFDMLVVRLMVALPLLFQALDDLLATLGTIAYRTGALELAERLGRFTPGDNYRRLIPLMEAVPAWLHGLWLLAGALYIIAIARFVRRRGAAHVLVLLALGAEILARAFGRPIIAATGVVANPNPSLIATILPLAFPLVIAGLFWKASRCRSTATPIS
jgi:hypothetical protein